MIMVHQFYENIQAGLHLIPIPMGLKSPKHREWNLPGHSLSIADFWREDDPLGGKDPQTVSWGVHHVDSGTCCVDIDNIDWARFQFFLAGLDLDAYLARYTGVYSGNPGHAKLMFKLPPGGEPLLSKQLYGGRVGEKPFASLNFRCATSTGGTTQDVMPPSLHPKTWEPYQWVNDRGLGAASLEYLPPELERFWRDLLQPEPVAAPEGPDTEAIPDERLQSALESLDPDCGRNEWIVVGMALHSALGDAGYALFGSWSAQGVKYQGVHDIQAVWRSFSTHPHGVTARSLFKLAVDGGWTGYLDAPAEKSLWEQAQENMIRKNSDRINPQLAAMLDMGDPPPAEAPAPAKDAKKPDEVRSRELVLQLEELSPLSESDSEHLNLVHKFMAEASRFKNPGYRDLVMDAIKREMHWNQRRLRDHLKFVKSEYRDAMDSLPGSIKFPFVTETGLPTDHSENLRAICAAKGIIIRKNRMSHGIEIYDPDRLSWYAEDRDALQLAHINDLCVEHRMPVGRADEHLLTLGTESTYHPLEEYILQTKWDGRNWFDIISSTVNPANKEQWELTFRRWALSVVAAVRERTGTRPPRGVLIMTGEQLGGKTSWFRYLTPDGMFHEGAHINPANKDSVKLATKYAIVELGELDETMKTVNLGRLKAFLSGSSDEIRVPYAHAESKWARRTVYCGTVNKPEFLSDQTGNTRFWVNEVKDINLDAMQALKKEGGIAQFWAYMNHLLVDGKEPWWLEDDEYAALEAQNKKHMEFNIYDEMLMDAFSWPSAEDGTLDLKPVLTSPVNPMTFQEIAQVIGVDVTTNTREGVRLREAIGRLCGQRSAITSRSRTWDNVHKRRRESLPGRFFRMPYIRSPAVPGKLTIVPPVAVPGRIEN